VEEDEGARPSQSIGEMLAQAGAAPQAPGGGAGAALAATDPNIRPGGATGVRTAIDQFSDEKISRARAMANEKQAATGEDQVVQLVGGTLAVAPASRANPNTPIHYST